VSGRRPDGRLVLHRFGVFHAGQQSARDPRYTVEPQRARVDAGKPVRFEG
jgi:hypothetical protein